ncbi:hypothetical protein HYH03_014757 [Edaphochlamys debaryana]|uniref:Uncharacterized protein n=1 Tax=Edaphochlamys debaryana TaxID=47281 RepID=A0A835XKR3_9CHLO|nr:hypothetical protein HYH03_014757 [Edaphochlamys debaryana]|eukprot:KAG2486587.1 hypothetical protein HYH03_014757 [Edaphochlamys debaryana]
MRRSIAAPGAGYASTAGYTSAVTAPRLTVAPAPAPPRPLSRPPPPPPPPQPAPSAFTEERWRVDRGRPSYDYDMPIAPIAASTSCRRASSFGPAEPSSAPPRSIDAPLRRRSVTPPRERPAAVPRTTPERTFPRLPARPPSPSPSPSPPPPAPPPAQAPAPTAGPLPDPNGPLFRLIDCLRQGGFSPAEAAAANAAVAFPAAPTEPLRPSNSGPAALGSLGAATPTTSASASGSRGSARWQEVEQGQQEARPSPLAQHGLELLAIQRGGGAAPGGRRQGY